MTTSATLDSASVRLDAGGQAVIPLQIRNTGEIVEGYHLEVVGVPAAWTTIEPEDLSLYPGSATTATVAFHPPRSATVPAGEMQFGVRVVPTEHPEEAVVSEGVVEVLPFLETTAELVPRTSRGRRSGRHKIAVDNRGNTTVRVVLLGTDPADALDVRTRPEVLTVGPGQALFSDLRVRPAVALWRGTPVTYPFTVLVSPQDGTPVALEGTHLQEPLLPPWLFKALGALLALLLLLAALWFLLLRPVIRHEAKDAAKDQVGRAEQAAVVAKDKAAEAGTKAGEAQTAAAKASGDATTAKNSATTAQNVATSLGPLVKAAGTPVSRPLGFPTTVKQTHAEPFLIGLSEKQTFRLTDLVLQNPQGDFGTVELSLPGRTLFHLALENFRDIDYHFVSPIQVTAAEPLTMTVTCNAVGAPPEAAAPTTCNTSAYVGGTVTGQAAGAGSTTPAGGQ